MALLATRARARSLALSLFLLPSLLVACAEPGADDAAAGDAAADVAAPAATQPAAEPSFPAEDVAAIDSILEGLYAVISGAAGEQRDWAAFEALFIDGARLIPSGPVQDGTGSNYRIMTPAEFVETSGAGMEEQGFFEVQAARELEIYGNIAHAFSTYESRRTAADPEPFMRGINSFQFLKTPDGWKVVTIFWQGESERFPIPEGYLTDR